MNKYLKALMAGILAWLMSAGNGIMALLQTYNFDMSKIGDGEWAGVMIIGFLSAAAGWATLLAQPGE